MKEPYCKPEIISEDYTAQVFLQGCGSANRTYNQIVAVDQCKSIAQFCTCGRTTTVPNS